ncbi:MAG TPA: chemotaxis protein CheA [Longimicrobiales bacterium]|nr:chemotaxis protein CheA [Longimicrobiales bacterium]
MSSGAGLPPEAMREILPEFMQESLDWMAQAEAALLELEHDPGDIEAVNVVLRAFHTVKGTSAFLGLDAVSGLAHDAESLLIPVRDGGAPFTRAHADLLLAATDATRVLLGHARERVMHGKAAGTSDEYQALRSGLRAAAEHDPTATRDQRGGTSDAGADDVGTAPDRSGGASGAGGQDVVPGHAQARGVDGEWTRVRTRRLDQLLDLVGELVVAQSMVAQDESVVRERHGPLAGKVLQTSRIVRELQSLSLGLRMIPLRPLFQRMQRLVRELSQQSGKQVRLVTEGADTEIDRRMVEALADPLVHMVRNAIDHGIERPDERVAGGKPPEATLRLAAAHAGGAVVLELQEDGRGLDRERILSIAKERGLVADGDTLSDAEVWRLIFAPGLSTAERVTDLSGRGVGMDVVLRSIEALRGRIEIESATGTGTTFTIRLPLTTAITDGLLVRVGAERYILPSLHVISSFRPREDAVVAAATIGGESRGEMVIVQERPVPIVRLHEHFGVADAQVDPARAVLVVMEDGPRRFALLVDELLGQQQFVAKPLTSGLRVPAGISGSAILGDGRVGLILDPAEIAPAARATDPAPLTARSAR